MGRAQRDGRRETARPPGRLGARRALKVAALAVLSVPFLIATLVSALLVPLVMLAAFVVLLAAAA